MGIDRDYRGKHLQLQFTVEDANPDELALWVPRIVDRLRQLPQLADVASDLQNGGLQVFVDIDRATASRFPSGEILKSR